MKIGYARVSTIHQDIQPQLDALTAAGCELIYEEKQPSAEDRPELQQCLKSLKKGDVLVISKMDRLIAELVFNHGKKI